MRILQVTPYFAPAWGYGGPPVTVYHLSKALAERGHKVTILTTDAFSQTQRLEAEGGFDGLEVHHFRNLSNYLAWKHQLFLPFGTRSFFRKHRSSFDIVHIHMYRTLQGLAAKSYAERCGIPYVFSAHGTLPRIVRMKFAKSIFDTLFGYRLLRDAAGLLAVSHAE